MTGPRFEHDSGDLDRRNERGDSSGNPTGLGTCVTAQVGIVDARRRPGDL
jgi:hypothetical protein